MELQRLRTKRQGAGKHRAAVLAASIFVVVLAGMAAFMFLFAKLQDLPRGHHAEAAPVQTGDSLPPAGYQETHR